MEIDIYGASGHAKVLLETIEELGYNVIRVIDDNPKIDYLGKYKIFSDSISQNLVLAIGNNNVRYFLSHSLNNKYYPQLIHPKSIVSKSSSINEGTVVMAGATINAETQIGKHCIINTNASIDHESVIDDFVHVSPNAALAGNVKVGEGTHIGIGACVIQGVKIGKWCTIGAGAVIVKDIPDFAVVVGNPGKIIKYNNH